VSPSPMRLSVLWTIWIHVSQFHNEQRSDLESYHTKHTLIVKQGEIIGVALRKFCENRYLSVNEWIFETDEGYLPLLVQNFRPLTMWKKNVLSTTCVTFVREDNVTFVYWTTSSNSDETFHHCIYRYCCVSTLRAPHMLT
jgi:hypothetical protein